MHVSTVSTVQLKLHCIFCLLQHIIYISIHLLRKSLVLCSPLRKTLKTKREKCLFFAFMIAPPSFALIRLNIIQVSVHVDTLFRYSHSNLAQKQQCQPSIICRRSQWAREQPASQHTTHILWTTTTLAFLLKSPSYRTRTYVALHLNLLNKQPNKHSAGKSALLTSVCRLDS